MRKICAAFLVVASLPLSGLSISPTRADDGSASAGMLGGLAAATLWGEAVTPPHPLPPQPAYIVPEPVYGSHQKTAHKLPPPQFATREMSKWVILDRFHPSGPCRLCAQ